MSPSSPQPPLLEAKCDRCSGRGWYDEGDGDRQRCGVCNGAGHVPTEWGERILALLRHNFRPLYEDIRQG
jgi:hypothetical protein